MTKNASTEVLAAAATEVLTGKTTKAPKLTPFEQLLKDAVKAQDKASKLWHDCQKMAINLAVQHRNVTMLTQLVQAVYNAKSVRATDLVKYILHLAGNAEGGEECALSWDSKEKKFGMKPGMNFRANACELSDKQAWYEWAKPESTKIEKFDALYSAIKRMNKLVQDGKVIPTADELEVLEACNKVIVRKIGADKVQVK